MMKFYSLKTCDTCRKAIKQLCAAGHAFEIIDVRADGVPRAVIETWLEKKDWTVVLNTRSTTWRGLDDQGKNNIDASKAVALMLSHPTLIKRPIIERGDEIFVGWKKDVQEQFGL